MRFKFAAALAVALMSLSLSGCGDGSAREAMRSDKSQVALRAIQTRTFDSSDRVKMLRAVIATMQDLGFVIDKADEDLGTVSGTKLNGYALKMTVTVRNKGERQLLVRANAQYMTRSVEDPKPYQDFFTSLEKAVFLTAHGVD